MAKILTTISYAAGGRFKVGTLDQDTGHDADFYAIDLVTQLAADAAFERRVTVNLTSDGLGNIVELKSEPAVVESQNLGEGAPILRISTGIQVGRLIAEVLFLEEPPYPSSERQGSTKDPVTVFLCQSAYVSGHRVVLTLADSGDITGVVKQRILQRE
jgi:hypothetical protein